MKASSIKMGENMDEQINMDASISSRTRAFRIGYSAGSWRTGEVIRFTSVRRYRGWL
jgi:hypothetical protein